MDADSISSKHVNMKADILENIRNGVYFDDKLPSARALSKQYDIPRMTVDRCLTELAREGLVERHVGRGTFVTASAVKSVPSRLRLEKFALLMDDDGMRHRTALEMVDAFGSHVVSRGAMPVVMPVHPGQFEQIFTQSLETSPLNGISGALISSSIVQGSRGERINAFLGAVPVVTFGGLRPDFTGNSFSHIATDREMGMQQAYGHLHALGHRHILLLGDTQTPAFADAMSSIQAMAGRQNVRLVSMCAQQAAVMTMVEELFAGVDYPTAIICLEWSLHARLYGVLHRRRLEVPGDVSLIGYGQNAMSESIFENLTTIEGSKRHETVAAIDLLYDMVEKDYQPGVTLSFPTWLVVRGTTGRAVQPQAELK